METKENSVINQNDYDQMLLNLIPRLKEFDSCGGSEGNVYFIDKLYVIKEYKDYQTKEDAKLFVKYCDEINGFVSRGYCLPRVYAHLEVLQLNGLYRIYMLQERAKGKSMYLDHIAEECYTNCSDFCSEIEFKNAIQKEEGSLYTKIMETYVREFLQTNEKLEAMEPKTIENFISTDYGLYKDHQYCWNDTQSQNIIIANNKMTLIDPSFITSKFDIWSDAEHRAMTMHDIFISFSDSNVEDGVMLSPQAAGIKSVRQLIEQNKRVCAAALTKFVKKTNRLLKPKFTSELDYKDCEKIAEEIVSQNDAAKILGELEVEF